MPFGSEFFSFLDCFSNCTSKDSTSFLENVSDTLLGKDENDQQGTNKKTIEDQPINDGENPRAFYGSTSSKGPRQPSAAEQKLRAAYAKHKGEKVPSLEDKKSHCCCF